MKTMSIEGFDKLVSQLILGNLFTDFDILESDTLLSDLNMGSIEKLTLAVDLEKKCDVDIADTAIDEFKSVGDVVEYLEQHVMQDQDVTQDQDEEKSCVVQQKSRLRKHLKNSRFSTLADNKDNIFVERSKRTGDFPVVATFKLS